MTGSVIEPVGDTTIEGVEAVVASAAAAASRWARLDLADRAAALRGIADRLDAHGPELVALAMAETGLAAPRLSGELRRTSFQLRLFAGVVLDRGFLDLRIDPPDPQWPMGAPRPDLRRMNVPLGPVLNFAASNFPFAFSVAGGDTASALAAGCPVIVKASPGHPRLSRRIGDLIGEAIGECGAPAGTFGLLFGRAAGVRALTHPAVAAAAFTGSTAGGRALYDIACGRPAPIPFFGELGSINPVFVTAEAAHNRAAEIASGLLAAVSSSAGQLCTKPGLVVIPADAPIFDEIAELARSRPMPTGPMLNADIAASFADAVDRIRSHPDVRVLTGGRAGEALVLATTAQAVLAEPDALLREMFGPATLLVGYRDTGELLELARTVGGQLTVSIFADRADDTARALIAAATAAAGRVLWNGWPVGVSVTHAQQHGGPYPATTAPAATSVGSAAVSRFLRPVVYQEVPEELLPPELRSDNPSGAPRSIDGSRPR